MHSIKQTPKPNAVKKHSNALNSKSKLLPKHLKKNLQLNHQHLNALIMLLNNGELDECVMQTQELAEIFPNNGLLWKILGTAYQKMGSNDLSIEPLKKALVLLPKDFEVAYNTANALF